MEEDIERRFRELEERIKKLEVNPADRPVGNADNPRKNMSIREFMLSKNPASDLQKTRTIGYFLEKYEGAGAFTKGDIVNGYRVAKEKTPNNVSDNLAKNVAAGHMMETKEKKDGKKAWILTNTGEKSVEVGFHGLD